jgi:hypothetical protein
MLDNYYYLIITIIIFHFLLNIIILVKLNNPDFNYSSYENEKTPPGFLFTIFCVLYAERNRQQYDCI